jgi:hypothetical protein
VYSNKAVKSFGFAFPLFRIWKQRGLGALEPVEQYKSSPTPGSLEHREVFCQPQTAELDQRHRFPLKLLPRKYLATPYPIPILALALA